MMNYPKVLQICLYPSDIAYIFMRYVDFFVTIKEKKLLKKVISIEFLRIISYSVMRF